MAEPGLPESAATGDRGRIFLSPLQVTCSAVRRGRSSLLIYALGDRFDVPVGCGKIVGLLVLVRATGSATANRWVWRASFPPSRGIIQPVGGFQNLGAPSKDSSVAGQKRRARD